MAEEQPEGGSETGGSLRARYESALEEKSQMEAELRSFKAAALIADKGFKYVTPDDLKGVNLAELPAKAAEIEQAKLGMRETVLKETLAAQGYQGDQLDDAVKKLLNPQESHAETSTRLASLGRIQGDFPALHEAEGLEGRALLRHAFEKQERNKPR